MNTKELAALELTNQQLRYALSDLIDACVDLYDGHSDEYPDLVKATELACKRLEQAQSK